MIRQTPQHAKSRWLKRTLPKSHNVVHPIPDVEWRRTGSSTGDSDEDDTGSAVHLVDAAMFLLEDTTLAAAAAPSEHQQTVGAAAARDWNACVEKCAVVKPEAVAVSRLLAMRNAVPSPSARMVFQSQVGQSLFILVCAHHAQLPVQAMKVVICSDAAVAHQQQCSAAGWRHCRSVGQMSASLQALSPSLIADAVAEMEQEESVEDSVESEEKSVEALKCSTPHAHATEAISAHSNMLAVEDWLASNESDAHLRPNPVFAQMAGATAQQQGPAAALVQQFEHLGSTSAPPQTPRWVSASPSDQSLPPTDKRPLSFVLAAGVHPTLLQTPSVTAADMANAGGAVAIELDKPLISTAQGAAARHAAAMQAHRARLVKGPREDPWAIAGRQTVARQGAKSTQTGMGASPGSDAQTPEPVNK